MTTPHLCKLCKKVKIKKKNGAYRDDHLHKCAFSLRNFRPTMTSCVWARSGRNITCALRLQWFATEESCFHWCLLMGPLHTVSMRTGCRNTGSPIPVPCVHPPVQLYINVHYGPSATKNNKIKDAHNLSGTRCFTPYLLHKHNTLIT